MLLRKELFDLKPFNDGYVLEKIDEYSKIIVPAKVGSYEIKAVDGLKGIQNINEEYIDYEFSSEKY